MPPKVRDLIARLHSVGWRTVTGGKGSHRKLAHVRSVRKIVISGKLNDDALCYQEKMVAEAIDEVTK